jgi:hypothetical protein
LLRLSGCCNCRFCRHCPTRIAWSIGLGVKLCQEDRQLPFHPSFGGFNAVPHDQAARNKAKAAADAGDPTALNAIRAADKVARVKRIARWESEAAKGNEEAIAKLAAYRERSVPVVISELRWVEIKDNVTRLLESIDSPELRIKEAEERVERIFSPQVLRDGGHDGSWTLPPLLLGVDSRTQGSSQVQILIRTCKEKQGTGGKTPKKKRATRTSAMRSNEEIVLEGSIELTLVASERVVEIESMVVSSPRVEDAAANSSASASSSSSATGRALQAVLRRRTVAQGLPLIKFSVASDNGAPVVIDLDKVSYEVAPTFDGSDELYRVETVDGGGGDDEDIIDVTIVIFAAQDGKIVYKSPVIPDFTQHITVQPITPYYNNFVSQGVGNDDAFAFSRITPTDFSFIQTDSTGIAMMHYLRNE